MSGERPGHGQVMGPRGEARSWDLAPLSLQWWATGGSHCSGGPPDAAGHVRQQRDLCGVVGGG